MSLRLPRVWRRRPRLTGGGRLAPDGQNGGTTDWCACVRGVPDAGPMLCLSDKHGGGRRGWVPNHIFRNATSPSRLSLLLYDDSMRGWKMRAIYVCPGIRVICYSDISKHWTPRKVQTSADLPNLITPQPRRRNSLSIINITLASLKARQSGKARTMFNRLDLFSGDCCPSCCRASDFGTHDYCLPCETNPSCPNVM